MHTWTVSGLRAFIRILAAAWWISPVDSIRYVSVKTSNGVNNQRESILNGLLLAHAINGTFVLPRVYPIWYKDAVGNSDGKNKWDSSKYLQPWTGRSL